MADAGILETHWSGFCTPGGHGPVAMALDPGFCNGVHIFGNSIIVEPGITASISYSGRWHPFQKHPPSIGAVTMELVDDQGKVWASSTGNVTTRSQYASIGAGAENVPGALPLGTTYRIMATVHDGTMCPPDDPKGKLVITTKGRPVLKAAARGGPALPPDAMHVRIKGKVHTRATRFGLKIRHWPKKRGKKQTPAQARAREDFKRMVTLVQQVPSWDRGAAQAIAHNSGWTYRDVLSKAVTGTLWSVPGMQSSALPFLLDALSSIEGSILYRGPAGWVGMAPGADGDVIVYHGGLPVLEPQTSLLAGVTQLHGSVLAGPGTGNLLSALSASGVAAGTYHHCSLTVTSEGRISVAANGAVATTGAVGLVKPDGSSITIDGDGTIHGASSAISQLTGAVVAGPGSGAQAATITATGVAAGAYHHATLTVNTAGQVTAAANGAVATTTAVGLVKPDTTTLTVDGSGNLSGIIATASANGISRPDGITTTINVGGQLSAAYQSPPAATLLVNGIVRPDGTTMTVDGTGKLTGLAGGGGGIGGLFSAAMSSRVTQTGSGPWSNAGGGVITDTNAGMVLTATTTPVWLHKNIPAGVHAVSVLLQQTALSGTNTECFVGFGDGTKAVLAQLEWSGSAWRYVANHWNAFNSFGSVAFTGPGNHVGSILWLKAYDDGTRINFYFSNDGVDWENFYNELRLANLASVSQIVLGSYQGAGNVRCNTMVSSYLESAS